MSSPNPPTTFLSPSSHPRARVSHFQLWLRVPWAIPTTTTTSNSNNKHFPFARLSISVISSPNDDADERAQDDVVDENVDENETENGATRMSIWLTGWLTMSGTNHTSRHQWGASMLDAQLVCFGFAKFSSLGLDVSPSVSPPAVSGFLRVRPNVIPLPLPLACVKCRYTAHILPALYPRSPSHPPSHLISSVSTYHFVNPRLLKN